jgi:hypothetical protein
MRLATPNRLLFVSRLDRLTFRSMKDCYELLNFKACTMTAACLPRLSRPDVRESISLKRLFALRKPYAGFFADRSVPIVSPDSIEFLAMLWDLSFY